jgi:hypothetical protein
MGPQVGQTVLYNNSGTIVPAIIYSVHSAGTVDLDYFNASGATSASISTAPVGTPQSRFIPGQYPGRLRRKANRRLWQTQTPNRPPVRCFGPPPK